MLKKLFTNQMREYVSNGNLLMAGMEPETGELWAGYGLKMKKPYGTFLPGKIVGSTLAEDTTKNRLKAIAGSAWIPALSAFNIGHSLFTDGIGAAYDTAVFELATSAATYRWAYGTLGTSGASAGINPKYRSAVLGHKGTYIGRSQEVVFGGGAGTGIGMLRGLGAAIGAQMGQSILGTPGAFIGAYIGAAPKQAMYKGVRLALSHPLIAGGAVAGVGAYLAAKAVGYSARFAFTEGRRHQLMRKGIDTSGDMAAFMTRNAFTMRSRAIMNIQKSHLNARSALGHEASMMYMPMRNFTARYQTRVY